MSQGLTCDRCGKNLLVDEEVRYVARIEVLAAYDPLELTKEDLERDREDEIRRLVDKLSQMTEDEVLDSVYRRFVFDLCPPCHRAYLQDPLGTSGAAGKS
jgi:hypothetical protein